MINNMSGNSIPLISSSSIAAPTESNISILAILIIIAAILVVGYLLFKKLK